MQTVSLKLLTIIAEDELESRLVRDLKELGTRGYTVAKVRGEGAHGLRGSEWEGENVRIETLVDPTLAERIAEHIAARYFERFAVIVYLTPAEVLRGGKFGKGP
jgi:nitrogen regulatory protein P-II 2